MNVNIKAPRHGARNINKRAAKVIITAESEMDEARLALLGRMLNATAETQEEFWGRIQYEMTGKEGGVSL